MGGNGRFEIRTGKQINPVTSDCRRALECLPSCHQALAELCNRHCFHKTWALHLRVHGACRITVCSTVIIWWRTLLKCPISGVGDYGFVDENERSLLVGCETSGFCSMPCALTHCPGVDLPLRRDLMHVPHCYQSATLHTGACTHEKVNAEVACDVPHGFNPVRMAVVSVP